MSARIKCCCTAPDCDSHVIVADSQLLVDSSVKLNPRGIALDPNTIVAIIRALQAELMEMAGGKM